MKKLNNNIEIKPINLDECVLTQFKCPIKLRDNLEELINEYKGKHTTEEIMSALLYYALKEATK